MSAIDQPYRLPTTEEIAIALSKILRFGPADVEVNRKGGLSRYQARRIFKQDVAGSALWPGLAIVGNVALRVAMEFADRDYVNTPLAVMALMAIPISLAGLPWKIILDLVYRKVETIEGKLDIEMRGVNDHISDAERHEQWAKETAGEDGESYDDWNDAQPEYHLRIKGMKFPASKRLVTTIEEGNWYRAYYTGYAGKLVVLEPKSG